MPACTTVLLPSPSGSPATAIQVGLTIEDAFRFETTRPPPVRVHFQAELRPIRLWIRCPRK